jgi:hypothetical protein
VGVSEKLLFSSRTPTPSRFEQNVKNAIFQVSTIRRVHR